VKNGEFMGFKGNSRGILWDLMESYWDVMLEYGLNKLYGELMTLKPMKYHLTME
jgi:hypothetical protein